MKKITFLIAIILTLNFSIVPVYAEGNNNNQTPKVHWVQGGTKVDMGDQLSSLKIDPSLLFLNADDTRALQKAIGNPPDNMEIGSIYPANNDENWFVVFEYDKSGHIKDDEKSDLNADAILKSYQQGTEEENKNRSPEDQIHITGWDIKPHYDDVTHNLTWSLKAEDSKKEEIINYNVRILTREGYVSMMLVSDPAHFNQDVDKMNQLILPNFEIKKGQRYEDYVPGKDKLSKAGLTGLILGGVGLAAAKKVGLLATILLFAKKLWILILAAIAFIGRFFNRFKRSKDTTETSQSEAPLDE